MKCFFFLLFLFFLTVEISEKSSYRNAYSGEA